MLSKLKDKILPEAKEMLAKVGKGEGSNYPASIAKVAGHFFGACELAVWLGMKLHWENSHGML